jgi:hypothetical protein
VRLYAYHNSGSIASIIRLPYVKGLAASGPDFWVKTQPLSIVSAIELGLGIIAASLATFRPLLRKAVEIFHSYRSRSNSKSDTRQIHSEAEKGDLRDQNFLFSASQDDRVHPQNFILSATDKDLEYGENFFHSASGNTGQRDTFLFSASGNDDSQGGTFFLSGSGNDTGVMPNSQSLSDSRAVAKAHNNRLSPVSSAKHSSDDSSR